MAFENQSGVFECEAIDGYFISWKVNGTGLSSLTTEVQKDLMHEKIRLGAGKWWSSLTIPAKNVYNGTTVQCVTGPFKGVLVESENVTLTIQGTFHA